MLSATLTNKDIISNVNPYSAGIVVNAYSMQYAYVHDASRALPHMGMRMHLQPPAIQRGDGWVAGDRFPVFLTFAVGD